VRLSQSARRSPEMASLPKFNIKLPSLNGKLSLGRSGSNVVGLDIQPGFAGVVQASVNGSILAERAAWLPLGPDVVREGEVVDPETLSNVLRELFATKGLSKRVRVGVANQRTVMRTLELPPVTDRKELAAAVRFQAQDQVPMPLSNAVLDFHPLGIVDTPGGPRQHVVLVAAQLDMVEHLLAAVRGAGLQPVGIDLSAFALIRSLYLPQPESEDDSRVVYLNVDGLTNLAIAEGAVCRFTRVVGGGMEGMAGELAERLGIPLADARATLLSFNLNTTVAAGQATVAHEEIALQDRAAATPVPDEVVEDVAPEEVSYHYVAPQQADPEQAPHEGIAPEEAMADHIVPAEVAPDEEAVEDLERSLSREDHDALEDAMSFTEMSSLPAPSPPPPGVPQDPPAATDADSEARRVLENGIREISGEVRNSLDFHRSQEGGGEVSHVVLSGSVLDVPGFAEALQGHLGLEVRTATVGLVDESSADAISMHRLAVAAGLATEEVHR
jgi:type IV pilus assembly protein PilM